MIPLNPVLQTAAQVAQEALQAPLNTIVAILALTSIFAVIGILYIVIRFGPLILQQIQQLITTIKQLADNNEKLTLIAGQNADQNKLTIQSIEKNTAEMTRQTTSIEMLTEITKLQGHDDNKYKILVSDSLSAHSEAIATNTANITLLMSKIEALPAQLKAAISDDLACSDVLKDIQKLRSDIMDILTKQQIGANKQVPTTEGNT